MPVLDFDRARALAADLHGRGLRIALTDGIFDLLHPGHVRYLRAARGEGDALIVGVLSDRSVRETRGPSRPITPEGERAEIVAALECVDAAVIVDDAPPHALVMALQPDVLVTRADPATGPVAGADTLESTGCRVVRLPLEHRWSTGSIIEVIQRSARP
jgi:D-beta-D-heptose 7-phosphate kinase/D-beta-D-heptose 1-phosphate adenosyltransferase